MNILIVNDDGYTSKGIKILQDALSRYGEVTVVAPHVEQSAKSVSITVREGIILHKHTDHVYSIEGTPSDCVKMALYSLNLKFDLVVSGINIGYNLGYDTLYSGTVGAGMEALINGLPSIAFSSDLDNFENAKREIDATLSFIFDNKLVSDTYLLNVNFPEMSHKASKGWRITEIGTRKFIHSFDFKDGKYYALREFSPYDEELMSDISAVNQGYTSITPLRLGSGDKSLGETLRKVVNQK